MKAPGGPGIEPRWTAAAKQAVGTARSVASHVWYTVAKGILTEVYWPTIDRPQIRDLQFLVTDGSSFFHEERRHLHTTVELLGEHALGMRIVGDDPEGRYRITKEIIGDPEQSCVLLRVRFERLRSEAVELRLFVLCAPHLEVGGWGNSGEVAEVSGRKVLVAHKRSTWLALGATIPFRRASVGYVGVNDGWQDLARDFQMDHLFEGADDGNIALTGELELDEAGEFTLGLAFADHRSGALAALMQSLAVPFDAQRTSFTTDWANVCTESAAMEAAAGDGGSLCHLSQSLLLAHEDKLYPGALIASLSIPWGEAHGDDDLGGYHLVWTRDLVNSATGLLASGHTRTALRALIYLSVTQRPDGGFHQNFWINGEPYWQGVQLDEVAFPILLAWRLHRLDALSTFDPWPMVRAAAGFLVRNGPATRQERWEEASGYSPSTLASNIAALTCAAAFVRERGEAAAAAYIQSYADFLEQHVEAWTVTNDGALLPGVPRHYIRISSGEDPDHDLLTLANQPPGAPATYPAREIVDAGFLELVRYGIRPPNDPLVEDSLRVVDAVLKAETPHGPAWRRYNHDGYGQRDDGGPFVGWGTGRPWPLLTGERGHYELAAGRSPEPYVQALEGLAHGVGLLPEQVWDEADRHADHLHWGGPTGAAMPLMWAHAEYLKLLRSTADGRVWDLIDEVAERYLRGPARQVIEYWKPNRQIALVGREVPLRIQAPGSFELVWSTDDWATVRRTECSDSGLGIGYVDIPVGSERSDRVRFTFYWRPNGRWEGVDYLVAFS